MSLGAAQLALVYETDKEQEGIETVINAVKHGINYIDTAPYYGQGKSEIALGKVIKYFKLKMISITIIMRAINFICSYSLFS